MHHSYLSQGFSSAAKETEAKNFVASDVVQDKILLFLRKW